MRHEIVFVVFSLIPEVSISSFQKEMAKDKQTRVLRKCTSYIPETYKERYSRTSFYLRGAGRPTIYAVKRQHISAVEKKLLETILWKSVENKENKST